MKAFVKDLGAGLGASLGIVAGFLPIAMSFGALTLQAGVSLGSTLGFSAWLFAGASQFALLESLSQTLSTWAALVTVVVINLRHVPMSLVAQRRYGHLPRWQQALLYHGLVDETFSLELADPGPRRFGFYLGLHVACWGAWSLGTLLGYEFGVFLPERWLRFALPGLFLCLLWGNVGDRPSRSTWAILIGGAGLTWGLRSLQSVGLLLAILLITLAASRWPRPRLAPAPASSTAELKSQDAP